MKEQLISFETAKLAKEKGFKCNSSDCSWAYLNTNGMAMSYDEKSCVLIPTQSLLQKWLREVHNIHIEINVHSCSPPEKFSYSVSILPKPYGTWNRINEYLNYEEALEKGLYEALKLINNQ